MRQLDFPIDGLDFGGTKIAENIMAHRGSVFLTDQEALRVILAMHLKAETFDCDPMFNQGMFYKDGIPLPEHRFDLAASANHFNAQDGDAMHLPLADNSIKSIILDPPFMFGRHGQTDGNRCAIRYTMFKDYDELAQVYQGIIREAARVLSQYGHLVFKCQDYTDSRTTMTHCLVWQWAQEAGFYAKDLAILNIEQKIFNGGTQQKHLRKTHCYFWVFRKQTPNQKGAK